MKKREIIIIGGGLMALTIAWELQQKGASVTVLGQNFAAAAGHAAAGMLAPQAEGLRPGAMLDLCLRSRSLYPAWAAKLEMATGNSVGYWPCGILVPTYADRHDLDHAIADWQTYDDLNQVQPGLSQTVQGGWWFPQDAQVDNQCLMRTLLAAVRMAGVEVREGITVQRLRATPTAGREQIMHLATSAGTWRADHYVLATGAWSQQLLPVPVTPRKGQMLALRWPQFDAASMAIAELPLQRVLFGEGIYVVPRQDGRIILGATSEDVGFAPGNTASGIHQLLTNALQLFPALAQCELLETWWGYRPATPDELPALGESPYHNLTLATGHYRNGVLLAPITGQIIADWIVSQQSDQLLPAFHWSRFKQGPPLTELPSGASQLAAL